MLRVRRMLIAGLCMAAMLQPAASQITTISAGPPTGALAYSSYGMVHVTWAYTGNQATSFTVVASPYDQKEDFNAALPSGTLNPWLWDYGFGVGSTYAVSGGKLSISVSGVSDSTNSRGNAAYLYRKLPTVSSPGGAVTVPTTEVQADCTAMFATHPNARCGIIVFNAGRNTHLLMFGITKRNSTSYILEVQSEGVVLASAEVNQAGGAWGSVAYLRVRRDQSNGLFRLSASSVNPTSWDTQTVELTVSQNSLVNFNDGDLWYGVGATAWDGSTSTFAAATFDYIRSFIPLPFVAPNDINGYVDACVPLGSLVQVVEQTVPASARAATFSGLSQNFPYSISVFENRADGSKIQGNVYVPHVYARPMPPKPWALGAYYDARELRTNSPVATGNRLNFWPDSSGNAHHLSSSGERRPLVQAVQGRMTAVTFQRTNAHFMEGGADSIDLGISTEFSLYTHALLTNSAPSLVAARGIQVTTTQPGWANMQYADFWNPWPGQRGVRITDGAGDMASLGVLNVQRWSYIYQGVSVMLVQNNAAVPGSGPTSLFPFPQKRLFLYRTYEVGTPAYNNDFLGYPDSPRANVSVFSNPVAVNWSTGLPYPTVSNDLNFHLGGPINPGGDTYRSLDGQLFGVLTYREAHDATTRRAVQEYLDWYQYRRCYSIVTPNVGGSAACNGGYRDDYCYQSCGSGFAQTSGTNDHWCQGGTWSGAPAICKRQCGTYPAPKFLRTCSKIILVDRFSVFSESWNRYIVYPSVPDILRDMMWRLDAATGTMIAFTNDACKRTIASHMALHPNRWDLIIPYGGLQRVDVNIKLDTATSIAGISLHFQSDTYMYLFTISASGGISLYRNGLSAANLVATKSVASIPLGEFFPFFATVTNLFSFSAGIGNVTYMSTGDPLQSGPSWGSAGMYADGFVAFRNFSISGSCDGGGACVAMSDGQSCQYTCKPGYKTVTETNGLVSCQGNGQFLGRMICLSLPPDMPPQNFSVWERSPEGSSLGNVKATPANPEQQIDYSIVDVFPKRGNATFTIGSCSGMILVADSTQLDYRINKFFIVTVKARPDGDEIAARLTNMTIYVLNIDDPPVFTPNPQEFNATENMLGPIGNVTYYDPDDDPANYSIILGNEQQLFRINQITGVLSVMKPLNYEDQAMFSLLVQVTQASNRNLIGTGQVNVLVADANDAPVMATARSAQDESIVNAPGLLVEQMSAYDVDNNPYYPEWSQLSYAIVTNAYNGSKPIFSISATNGSIYLATPLKYTYEDGFEWVGGVRTRAQYSANISACDAATPALCAYATATLTVIANYSAPLRPVVLSYDAPFQGFSTLGGETITFNGRDFGVGQAVNASYCAGLRCYNATDCAVKDIQTITCKTIPGWGTDLSWSIKLDGNTVPTSVQIITRYAAPMIDLVQVQGGSLATMGGAIVNITGSNFGPNDTAIDIRVGVNQEFTMERLEANHLYIIARLQQGCGINLPVSVRVGAQWSQSSNLALTTVSYDAPSISGLRVGALADYTLSTLGTAGGDVLIITGTNFGPLDAPVSSGRLVLPLVAYSGGPQGVLAYQAVSCFKTAALAHNEISCLTAPGAGANFTWSVQVCGQWSGPSIAKTSYRPPTILSVSGTGKSGASTEGGQQLSIYGYDLGYIPTTAAESAIMITWVKYGAPSHLQFEAESCRMSSVSRGSSRIDCLTAPGTGSNHTLRVNIAGQLSNLLISAMSYGEPVISAFDRAILAVTPGGDEVLLNGTNFGYDISLVNVTYTDQILSARVSDNTVPGNPPGVAKYKPYNCTFVVPHRSISCQYTAGGGNKLIWDMVVDGQQSASPTTSYFPPSITDVQLLDGAQVASTRGGTRVRLVGTNFGISSLIQAIRYGVTGFEYAVKTFQYVSHSELILTLGPGIGRNLRFTIEVADQVAEPSTATISYATPEIVSVSPSSSITFFDPARPVMVTVTGREFGLLDPTADVGISFGNSGDGTLFPLTTPVSRYPTADSVLSGTFVPPNPSFLETVSFILPETLGANRSVRVVSYRRGQLPSNSEILAIPVDLERGVFSFRDPVISQVSPNVIAAGNESALVRAMFTDAVDFTDFRRIVIAAPTLPQSEFDIRSFGPPQLTDTVQRIVEFKYVRNGHIVWDTLDVKVASWNHSQIVAYSRVSAATLRVRIMSADPLGNPVVQISNEYTFSRVSPTVNALIGTLAGYATQGGEALRFKAGGLATTVELNVTVGGRNAQLLDANGQPVSPAEARDRIILAQGRPMYPPYPDDFAWDIQVLTPPGEGKSQAVRVVRDGLESEASADNSIDYLPPLVSSFSMRTSTGAASPMPWSPAVAIIVPTHSTSLRLIGSNLGLCPLIQFVTSNPVAIDACPIDPITRRKLQNTEVNRTHNYIEVSVPTGEGTGVSSALTTGWFITLNVGGQAPAAGRLFLRYAPPVVYSISPAIGPTSGNITLTIVGDNFGEMSMPLVWIGSGALGFAPCAAVVRLSHTRLQCTLPEGSGRDLQARVQLSDQAGTGGSFSYARPVVQNVTISALRPLMLTPEGYNGSITAEWTHTTESYGAGLLQGDTLGGYHVTLTGWNFGPRRAGVNCVFSMWPRYLVESAQPVCNGQEDYLGEGEIAEWNILRWSHKSVTFSMPPGEGSRKFTMLIGGQTMDAALPGYGTVDFVYQGPMLTESFTVVGKRSTEGGDTLSLRGIRMPPAVYRNPGSSLVTFPLGLGALNGSRAMLPMQHTVITFGGRCITDAMDEQGRLPPGMDRLQCLQTGPIVPTQHTSWYSGKDAYGQGGSMNYSSPVTFGQWQVDLLSFKTPAGIGVNKSVSVKIFDYFPASGEFLQISESNALNFSYAPPNITFVDPSPLYILDLTADNVVLIGGENFGKYQDRMSWTEAEQHVEVHTGGILCKMPERIVRKGLDMVQCMLNSAEIAVGFKNMSILVAGQMGYLSEDNPQTLQVVCGKQFYGHRNETCMDCPLGAKCSGYLVGYGRDRPIGLLGNVEHDGTGLHTYPIPMPGFYNLNGTEREPCPPMKATPNRDVCVVACVPLEACLGDNVCAPAYMSKAPNYRCASCAKGYYRRGPECIKCPDSPYALIVGVVLLLFGLAGVGYYLQRAKINISLVSIGIDYFQVLAIFANSKIKWPPEIRELLHILSAFNLNIEIVAPECLVPDVSFMQKWSVIMAIPLGVYMITAMIHMVLILYRLCIKRQERKVACSDAGSMAMSSILSIFYLMYIYLSKNVFDVMTCVPADPPDGLTYMTAGSAAMEPCGKPGGTQVQLLPWAIAALIVYVLGYPIALAVFFYYRGEKVMLDQLLRAKGVGDDILTNPYALTVRRTCSRAYYAFKPDYFWWALCVITRKLLITCTYVMFAQIPAFQLAASILIVFLAYAAQVKFNPYMPVSDYDEVVRDHLLMSLVPNSVHHRLHQVVQDVESRGKKVARKNAMQSNGRVAQAGKIVTWLFNNNTVESILLFCAIIINLMAIMYAAVEKSPLADEALPRITAIIIAVLIISITYYAAVLIGEICLQCAMRRERKAIDKGKTRGAKAADVKKQQQGGMSAADVKKAAYEAASGKDRKSTAMAFNPMFASGGSESQANGEDTLSSAIFARAEPPDMGLWLAFKKQYGDLVAETSTITKELNNSRSHLQRIMDVLHVNSPDAALAAVSTANLGAAQRPALGNRTRTAYKPLTSPGEAERTNPLVTARSNPENAQVNPALGAYFSPATRKPSARVDRTESGDAPSGSTNNPVHTPSRRPSFKGTVATMEPLEVESTSPRTPRGTLARRPSVRLNRPLMEDDM